MIINPNTGDYVIYYIVEIVTSITGIIGIAVLLVKKNRKSIRYMAIVMVIGLVSLPLITYAIDKLTVTVKFANLYVNGVYIVTIDPLDGRELIKKEIKPGDMLGELPELEEKEGYNFTGWYDEEDNEVTEDTIVIKEIDIKPKYAPKEYTVTFETGEGTCITPQKIFYQNKATKPTVDPIKNGYDFYNWYTTDEYTEEFDFENTEITKDITIYAKYTPFEYRITYNLNNGLATNRDTYTIETDTFTLANPTKAGYTFIGWTKNNETTKQDTVTIVKGSTGNLEFTAHYTVNTDTPYTVVHKKMNKDGITYSVEETENLVGETDSEVTPAVKNYIGFNSPSTQTVTILGDGSRIVEYLYKRVQYTVSFNSNGGSNVSKRKVYYQNKVLKPTNPTKKGYLFGGWYTTDEYIEKFDFENTEITENITLYAKWNNFLVQQTSEFSNTFGKNIARSSFESITTVDNINIPENAIDSWDVSVAQNGSIMAWYLDEDNDESYELYIGQNGGVIANPDSSYLFYKFSKVTEMDLSHFDTSNVTNMDAMFYWCNPTNLDLSSFDTSNVTSMGGMFYYSRIKNIDLSSFNTSKVTNMSFMFSLASGLSSLDLRSFDTSNVTDMRYMFNDAQSLTNLDISSFDTSKVTNMSRMFADTALVSLDLSHFDTSKVTDMSYMFSNWAASPLRYLDISSFNTSEVTDMSGMFAGLSLFTSLDLSHFDTRKVTKMNGMFEGMTSLTDLNISSFNTSNVTDMHSMFMATNSLTSLDLSHFDTKEVKDMSYMFGGSTSLASLDLSNFDTKEVKNMEGMFNDMTSLTSLDLSKFNTSSVTNMRNMFNGMTSLTDLNVSSFDTSKVKNMSGMFDKMSSLKKLDLSSFEINADISTRPSFYQTSLEELKTPKFIASSSGTYTISLNTTLKSESGTSYTKLSSTTPTNVWLKKSWN